MSLALKLDRARQSLEYWQKMSEDPKLSALAASAVRDRVRYYRGAVARYEKAFAYQHHPDHFRELPIRSAAASSRAFRGPVASSPVSPL